ncbi:hypothetical protein DPMN_138881 [Dreissena polymorpha]|uniref:Uncharacterized protein n=1 Tax=Dreissena polymorpha TaxID=45954 RepID=A0A9D4JF45_DREPO|nr:hypothetical protein DPMN_138881 [Dreissena polymorpha]
MVRFSVLFTCDRWRRVKEATGIEKDEKMMEILIDATTSELESFNNHLLMYAPKRNAFSYAKEIRGERVHSKAAGN